MSGSGASDIFTPDYLIEADIMVITVNHRLGPFGKMIVLNVSRLLKMLYEHLK